MANSTVSLEHPFEQDHEVWASLKQAIATSSGFRRWQEEQISEPEVSEVNLDSRVRSYLRETLETLAY